MLELHVGIIGHLLLILLDEMADHREGKLRPPGGNTNAVKVLPSSETSRHCPKSIFNALKVSKSTWKKF
jgi:hypothetical protein